MKPRWATVTLEPSERDIARMVKAGSDAVMELVMVQGAAHVHGHNVIAERYMRRLYAAVIAGRRRKRKGKK